MTDVDPDAPVGSDEPAAMSDVDRVRFGIDPPDPPEPPFEVDPEAVGEAWDRMVALEQIVAELLVERVSDVPIDGEAVVAAPRRGRRAKRAAERLFNALGKVVSGDKGGWDVNGHWHDPNTGRYAPKGYVSAKVLKGMLRGDGPSRSEFLKHLNKKARENPEFGQGAWSDRFAAEALGPRPQNIESLRAWEAAYREMRNWHGNERRRRQAERLAEGAVERVDPEPDDERLERISEHAEAESIRDAARAAGDEGVWLVAKDNYLSRIGVTRGQSVKVKWSTSDRGIVDAVDEDGNPVPTPVKWDRFVDDVNAVGERVEQPVRRPNRTRRSAGAGRTVAERAKAANGEPVSAVLADNYLHGWERGEEVRVRWLSDSHGVLVGDDGRPARRAAWARFVDDPDDLGEEPVIERITDGPTPDVDPLDDPDVAADQTAGSWGDMGYAWGDMPSAASSERVTIPAGLIPESRARLDELPAGSVISAATPAGGRVVARRHRNGWVYDDARARAPKNSSAEIALDSKEQGWGDWTVESVPTIYASKESGTTALAALLPGSVVRSMDGRFTATRKPGAGWTVTGDGADEVWDDPNNVPYYFLSRGSDKWEWDPAGGLPTEPGSLVVGSRIAGTEEQRVAALESLPAGAVVRSFSRGFRRDDNGVWVTDDDEAFPQTPFLMARNQELTVAALPDTVDPLDDPDAAFDATPDRPLGVGDPVALTDSRVDALPARSVVKAVDADVWATRRDDDTWDIEVAGDNPTAASAVPTDRVIGDYGDQWVVDTIPDPDEPVVPPDPIEVAPPAPPEPLDLTVGEEVPFSERIPAGTILEAGDNQFRVNGDGTVSVVDGDSTFAPQWGDTPVTVAELPGDDDDAAAAIRRADPDSLENVIARSETGGELAIPDEPDPAHEAVAPDTDLDLSAISEAVAEPDGGFTATLGGEPVTTGIVVAISGYEARVPHSQFKDKATAQRFFADYVRAIGNDPDVDADTKIGGWHDPDTSEVVFDRVEVFTRDRDGDDYREKAIAAGRERGEHSIFDLDTGEMIRTGGTGSGGALLDRLVDPESTTPPDRGRVEGEGVSDASTEPPSDRDLVAPRGEDLAGLDRGRDPADGGGDDGRDVPGPPSDRRDGDTGEPGELTGPPVDVGDTFVVGDDTTGIDSLPPDSRLQRIGTDTPAVAVRDPDGSWWVGYTPAEDDPNAENYTSTELLAQDIGDVYPGDGWRVQSVGPLRRERGDVTDIGDLPVIPESLWAAVGDEDGDIADVVELRRWFDDTLPGHLKTNNPAVVNAVLGERPTEGPRVRLWNLVAADLAHWGALNRSFRPPDPRIADLAAKHQQGWTTDDERDFAHAVFDHDLGNGYESEVTAVTNYGGGIVAVKGSIFAEDGSIVGTWERSLHPGERTVTHDVFQLDSDHQKQGIATAFIALSEDSYEQSGLFDWIATRPLSTFGEWNGSYTWARLGFNWGSEQDAEVVADHFRNYLSQLTVEEVDEFEALEARRSDLVFGDPEYPTPNDYALIGWADGLVTWGGRDIMADTNLGGDEGEWEARKRIYPNPNTAAPPRVPTRVPAGYEVGDRLFSSDGDAVFDELPVGTVLSDPNSPNVTVERQGDGTWATDTGETVPPRDLGFIDWDIAAFPEQPTPDVGDRFDWGDATVPAGSRVRFTPSGVVYVANGDGTVTGEVVDGGDVAAATFTPEPDARFEMVEVGDSDEWRVGDRFGWGEFDPPSGATVRAGDGREFTVGDDGGLYDTNGDVHADVDDGDEFEVVSLPSTVEVGDVIPASATTDEFDALPVGAAIEADGTILTRDADGRWVDSDGRVFGADRLTGLDWVVLALGDDPDPLDDPDAVSDAASVGASTVDAVVEAALWSWIADPIDMRLHMQDEIDGAPLPGNAGGRAKREQAAALLGTLRVQGRPNDKPLYRGATTGGDPNPIVTSWSENRETAERFARSSGGTVQMLPQGAATGVRMADIIDAQLDESEQQWLILSPDVDPLGDPDAAFDATPPSAGGVPSDVWSALRDGDRAPLRAWFDDNIDRVNNHHDVTEALGDRPDGTDDLTWVTAAEELSHRAALNRLARDDKSWLNGFVADRVGDNATRRWTRSERGRVADAVFAHSDLGNGYSSAVVSFEADGPYLEVNGAILDANGEQVGEFDRIIDWDDGTVEHGVFKLWNEADRGRGVGAAFMALSLDAYEQTGAIDTILVDAHSDESDEFNGGYTWARLGFQWMDADEARKVAAAFWAHTDLLDADAQADLAALEERRRALNWNASDGPPPDGYPTPDDYARIGWREGKEGPHGGRLVMSNYVSWHGRKDVWAPPEVVTATRTEPAPPAVGDTVADGPDLMRELRGLPVGTILVNDRDERARRTDDGWEFDDGDNPPSRVIPARLQGRGDWTIGALPRDVDPLDDPDAAADVAPPVASQEFPWKRPGTDDRYALDRFPNMQWTHADNDTTRLARVDAGTGDWRDDRIAGLYLSRTWDSPALVDADSDPALAGAMNMWRGSFPMSAAMRQIMAGEPVAPAYQNDTSTERAARLLADAIEDGSPVGAVSYRTHIPRNGESFDEGDVFESPAVAVAFNIEGAAEYERDHLLGSTVEKVWLEFPHDANGVIFDDSETPLAARFRSFPQEGIVGGRFRVARVEERRFRNRNGVEEVRRVAVLERADGEPVTADPLDDPDAAFDAAPVDGDTGEVPDSPGWETSREGGAGRIESDATVEAFDALPVGTRLRGFGTELTRESSGEWRSPKGEVFTVDRLVGVPWDRLPPADGDADTGDVPGSVAEDAPPAGLAVGDRVPFSDALPDDPSASDDVWSDPTADPEVGRSFRFPTGRGEDAERFFDRLGPGSTVAMTRWGPTSRPLDDPIRWTRRDDGRWVNNETGGTSASEGLTGGVYRIEQVTDVAAPEAPPADTPDGDDDTEMVVSDEVGTVLDFEDPARFDDIDSLPEGTTLNANDASAVAVMTDQGWFVFDPRDGEAYGDADDADALSDRSITWTVVDPEDVPEAEEPRGGERLDLGYFNDLWRLHETAPPGIMLRTYAEDYYARRDRDGTWTVYTPDGEIHWRGGRGSMTGVHTSALHEFGDWEYGDFDFPEPDYEEDEYGEVSGDANFVRPYVEPFPTEGLPEFPDSMWDAVENQDFDSLRAWFDDNMPSGTKTNHPNVVRAVLGPKPDGEATASRWEMASAELAMWGALQRVDPEDRRDRLTVEDFDALDSDQRRAYTEAVFNHDLGNGYESVVRTVSYGFGSFSVEGNIRKDGVDVGRFKRTMSTRSGTISHDVFAIWSDDHRKGGVGTAFIALTHDAYEQAGVFNRIIVGALSEPTPEWNGGYTWPRLGFGWGSEDDAAHVAAHFERHMYMMDSDEQDRFYELERLRRSVPFGDPVYPTPNDYALIGYRPDRGNWAGQEIMGNTHLEYSLSKPVHSTAHRRRAAAPADEQVEETNGGSTVPDARTVSPVATEGSIDLSGSGDDVESILDSFGAGTRITDANGFTYVKLDDGTWARVNRDGSLSRRQRPRAGRSFAGSGPWTTARPVSDLTVGSTLDFTRVPSGEASAVLDALPEGTRIRSGYTPGSRRVYRKRADGLWELVDVETGEVVGAVPPVASGTFGTSGPWTIA